MSNKVALTASMRSNLLSLKSTQKLFDSTQDKLSTGYKVNSAMDNPSSYFTAQSLNSRANDLSTLLDSIGQAISTLEVADQGITTLQDMVEQAKSVAQSARDTSNVSASVSSNVKFGLDTLRSELVTNQVNGVAANDKMTIRVGDATKLTGSTNVNDDTTLTDAGIVPASTGSISVDGTEYTLDFSGTTEQMVTGYASGEVFKIVSITNSAGDTITVEDKNGVQSTFELSAAIVDVGDGSGGSHTAAVGDTIKLSGVAGSVVSSNGQTTTPPVSFTLTADGSGDYQDTALTAKQTATIYVANTGTVGDMANTIQNMIGNTKISVSVEDSNLNIKTLDTSSLEVTGDFADQFGLDVGTTLTLDSADTAESLRQRIAGIDGVTAEFDKTGHLVVKSAEGDDLVISGALADALGVSGAATNGSNERAAYAKQFNNIMTQIDQLVQDTSYKGINLLKGDNLTVNFNESRTSSIELKGVTFDSVGMGFTQAANEWKDNASIDKSLDQITKATSMLRAQASEFGQNLSTVQIREDFTQNMINNLQSGADKLTLADMNEEGANMLALQTRQQLGLNSLSLASQAAQGVLRLF